MQADDPRLKDEAKLAQHYYALGMVALKRGQLNEAIDHFTNSIDFSKHVFNASVYFNRGAAYIATGEFQKGIDDYLNPIANFSELDKSTKIFKHTNLGYAYYMQGATEKAIENYKIVLELDPFDRDAQLMLDKLADK